MKAYVIAVSFLLSLLGCIKDADTTFNFKSKIAVYAHANNYDRYNYFNLFNNVILKDTVAWSKHDTYRIKDATVFISDELGNSKLMEYSAAYQYRCDSNEIKFVEGRKYSLKITTPDGREANATIQMPTGAEIKSVDFDTSLAAHIGKNGWLEREVNISMRFSGNENYNSVFASVIYAAHYKKKSGKDTVVIATSTEWLAEKRKKYLSETTVKFTNHIAHNVAFDPLARIELLSVIAFTETEDETAIKHQKTIDDQAANVDDPFAEPTLLYSNINNGLGIFTGSSLRSKKIMFK